MSNLDKVMKNINKASKDEIISTGVEYKDIERIPFISPRVDYMLYGGLPMKRISELSGAENSGKTTTALGYCAMAQKSYPDRKVVIIDAENTLDAKWAKKIGVDTDELIIMRPYKESAEDIFDYIYEIIDTGEVSLLVLDSIPALTPANQLNESVSKSTYCGIAGPLSKFVRDVTKKIEHNNTALLIINQIRDDLNSMWSNHRTPGGKALKHFSAVRLFTKKGKFLDKDLKEVSRNFDNPYGHRVEVQIKKTKICKPDRPYGSYTLIFNDGIDYFEDAVDVALMYNILLQRGAWYYIIDPDTGEILKDEDDEDVKFQGKDNLKIALRENKAIWDNVTSKINKKLKEEH